MPNLRLLALAATVAVLPLSTAHAGEWWVSMYGGYNTSADSDVKIKQNGTSVTYDSVSWDGASFAGPPYFGARVGYWFDGDWSKFGLLVDYSHAKVKADLSGTALGDDFSHFEFTDGLNLLTLNGLYRMPMGDIFTPYVGLGLGVAVPHVETVSRDTSTNFPTLGKTWEYQLSGPAAQAQIGVDAKITKSISAFAEYKFNYSWNSIDLKNSGHLDTDIATSQFIFGLSYKFN